jgi:hypothetical protein
MPMLIERIVTEQSPYGMERLTLAVVLLQVINAFAAAETASLVSITPISGTVPSSSAVAGSFRNVFILQSNMGHNLGTPTGNSNSAPVFGVYPLPINEALAEQQRGIFQCKLERYCENPGKW